jgi:hypothetical protein
MKSLHNRQVVALAAFATLIGVAGCGGGSDSSPIIAPAPGPVPINTGTGWSDSPSISRDGQRLYFMYSRYNFGPWIISNRVNPPVLSGPDRPGLRRSTVNPFDESDIYLAVRNTNGTWTEPVNLDFNGAFGDSSGMEIASGSAFVWLRGNGSTNDIVVATRNTNGVWSAPEVLGAAVNDHSAGVFQDNPHLSPDGNHVWFTSNRANGLGGTDIWYSTKIGGTWAAAVNLGAPINTAGNEDQIWISPVSTDVFWNGPQGIMHCQSNGSTCAHTPTVVVIPGCDFAAEPSLPDDGQTLYFACGNLTTGMIRIMYSVKQTNGSWGPATPVD